MKRPWIIAHRGYSAQAPENTLAAFELAVRSGVDGVEFDVWLCASGEVIVTHDQNPLEKMGVAGDIEKMTLKEIRDLDAGSHFHSRFRGEKIPTLPEVLELCRGLSCVNIEIKGERLRSSGVERIVADILKINKNQSNIVVSSFNPLILYRLKKQVPSLKCGLLFYEKSSRPLRHAWAGNWLSLYSLHPSVGMLIPPILKKARKKSQKIFAWTVNDASQLQSCLHSEVDAVITDDPGEIQKLLTRMQADATGLGRSGREDGG